MEKKDINRRKFMDLTLKTIAASAGLSVAKLNQLLAAESQTLPKTRTVQKVQKYDVYKKSTDAVIKGLKVLIENDRRIFENEYGRLTPMETRPIEPWIPEDLRPGDSMLVCPIFWVNNVSDMLEGLLGCGVVFSQGVACPQLVECGGGNNCSGQDCPNLCVCRPNNCPGNDCGNLGSCLPGCGCEGGNTQILGATFFDRYKNDPYVQSLHDKFNTTDPRVLSLQVNKMLIERRQTIRR